MIERSKVELRPRGEGHELVVEVPSERGFGIRFGRTPQVGCASAAREGAKVSVHTRSADVVARGASGPRRCRTVSGEIRWDDVDGDAALNSTSGDVRVGAVTGGLSLKTVSGDGEVGKVGGRLTAEVVSGDLRVDDAEGR